MIGDDIDVVSVPKENKKKAVYRKKRAKRTHTKADDNGNAMLQESLNFKDACHTIYVPLAMSANLQKAKFQT